MAPPKCPRRSGRIRIGRVSVYHHHGAHWLYFREKGKAVRRKVGGDRAEAEAVGARVNAELAAGQQTLFSFTPVPVHELARQWLDHHEQVLRSSVATCSRYRTAVGHLIRFAESAGHAQLAHEVNVQRFVEHLRHVHVAPNGHANARKRRLRDKGVKFILGVCRSMYNHAARVHLLPPRFENPFAALPIERLPVEDAKPIHVFSADEEARFLDACDDWSFPIFYVLAKTGLRPGELTHLLVEDLDRTAGVLRIRNKADLSWSTKTRNIRAIPLPAEPLGVLKAVIGGRSVGLVFRRLRFADG